MGINIAILVISILLLLAAVVFSVLLAAFIKDNWKKVKAGLFFRNNNKVELSQKEKEQFTKSMLECLFYLSSKKIGALIVLEKNNSLSLYEETGFKLDANFSPEFLISVFSNKSVSFHDGALIVSRTKIKSISCYLPISKNTIDLKYGARHRAALGISEVTDAIAIVVSETTGNISYARKSKLNNLGQDKKIIEEIITKLI